MFGSGGCWRSHQNVAAWGAVTCWLAQSGLSGCAAGVAHSADPQKHPGGGPPPSSARARWRRVWSVGIAPGTIGQPACTYDNAARNIAARRLTDPHPFSHRGPPRPARRNT
jgi:hypothetical protein